LALPIAEGLAAQQYGKQKKKRWRDKGSFVIKDQQEGLATDHHDRPYEKKKGGAVFGDSNPNH